MGPAQGTVARWDPATRAGALVRDDGVEVPFEDGGVDPRVRLLRPGQRVRYQPFGAVAVAVTLLTLWSADAPD